MFTNRRLVKVRYSHDGNPITAMNCWLTDGRTCEDDLPKIIGLRQGFDPESVQIASVMTLQTAPVLRLTPHR